MKRRFQYIFESIYSCHPRSQIALGAALGMFVGLIPKDSLLVFLACLLLLASAANLYSGILSALVFTIVGWLGEPLLHKLGAVILTNEALVRTWSALFQQPGLPWTRLNNTVVMGGFIASLLLCYPLFQAVRGGSGGISARHRDLTGHLVELGFRRNTSDSISVSSR